MPGKVYMLLLETFIYNQILMVNVLDVVSSNNRLKTLR